MTRSALFLSVGLLAGFTLTTVLGCGGNGDGGTAGSGGSTAGSGGGAAGSSGGSAAGTGPAGSGGGAAGTGGGAAGTGGGAAGTGGGAAGTGGGAAGRGGAGGGAAGTGGGAAGTGGGAAGRGGAGGGAAGAGGGAAGRGGAGGGAAGAAGRGGSGGGGGATATLTLTSTAYTSGSMIPAVHTCAGADTSPDLSWSEGPAGTMSYAIVFTDMSNNLVHWVIWDIPAATRMLPAALQEVFMPATVSGAKQVSFQGNTDGYFGPCPNGQTHTYVFQVHAISVATLPGNLTMTSTPANVVTQINMAGRSLATGTLSGMSNAMN
jgi:Raf kinase inhibitor-like YbhB/YbcL family protein